MRSLSDFIRSHETELIEEWERFARSLPGGSAATVEVLRDHAREMLHVIADDLDTPQTTEQQRAKSFGEADTSAGAKTATAAQKHGAGRAERGFSVGEMVSEFRALRASVLRHWAASGVASGPRELDDITRFNEAIDQAIAESIQRYARDVENARERFIGILGHDLITPIGAITTAARFMQESPNLPEPLQTLAGSIESSGTRMQRMVGDLLDFARTRLGEAIPITRRTMDLRDAVQAAVAETIASNPGTVIDFESTGNSVGSWDYDRVIQVAGNLIGNAVQHGESGTPVVVRVHGKPDEVEFSVNNRGPVIPSDRIPQLFAAGQLGANGKRRHLGLGLYIVDQIVKAHEGTVAATSSEQEGTTFTVHLPR